MIDGISDQLITIVLTAVFGGVVGFASGIFLAFGRFGKALRIGLRTLLRMEIIDAYQKYVVEDEEMSLERGQELDDAYQAYELAGGNGLIKRKIWPALEAKNPYIVGADVRHHK